MTFRKTTLYITADEIHGALRRLGPVALRDEAIISVAVRTFADMVEGGGTFVVQPFDRGARIEKVEG